MSEYKQEDWKYRNGFTRPFYNSDVFDENKVNQGERYYNGCSLYGSRWNDAEVELTVEEMRKQIRSFIPKKFQKYVKLSQWPDKTMKINSEQCGSVDWVYDRDDNVVIKNAKFFKV